MDQRGGVVGRDPLGFPVDVDRGVELAHPYLGDLGLAVADLVLAVDRLALEVGGIDSVVVDQRQRADSRRGEVLQRRTADSAEADHGDMRLRQHRLPCAADLGQHDVPRETAEAVRGEDHRAELGRRGGFDKLSQALRQAQGERNLEENPPPLTLSLSKGHP